MKYPTSFVSSYLFIYVESSSPCQKPKRANKQNYLSQNFWND